MPASLRSFLALLLAFAGLSLFISCREADEDPDQYLNLTLNASYADYDTVHIRLMDAADTSELLETVWNGKIPDPAKFAKHKLKEAKGKDFIIQIRCYNAQHELLLAKDVKVEGKRPNASVVLVPELRLSSLKPSAGNLTPGFGPGTYAYLIQVGEDVASISLTATAIDPGNVLSVDGTAANWGAAVAKDLVPGPNVIVFTVSTKDGRKSRTYEVTVNRGRVIPPEEVTGVTLPDTALILYTGEGPTALKANVTPPGAMFEWSSSAPNVASVDGAGRVSHVGPGDAKVTVKAGNFSASVDIKVKRDVPMISVGDNIAVKPGVEVAFEVAITQEHGKYVSFKYDLDADSAWDNTDTGTVAATRTLKHTYAKIGTFVARFEVRDGEGNLGKATRTVTVDNSAFQLAITSPRLDTLINTRSILVKYTVNDTPLEKTFSDLPEGASTVTIDTGTGADKRSETRQITVDTKAPGAPVYTGTATSTLLKPTWTWKSGGEGNGRFRASLDSAGLSVAVAGTSAAFTPPANLIPGIHILWVQESDEAGNWSPPGKFAITIKTVDTTPPAAPKITAPATTNTAPKWTWTTGGGGVGIYKFKLGDSTLAGAVEGPGTSFTLAEAPVNGKAYTLYVAERDSSDLWSKPASATITFDARKPNVVIAAPAPSGTFYTTKSVLPFSGTVTGLNPITKVSFKINLVHAADAVFDNGNWTIAAVPVAEGSVTIVTIVATDSLGITGEATLNVLRDNTNPGAPTITTGPASPTKSATGGFAWTKGADNANGSGLNDKYRWSWDSATWTETKELLVSALALKEGNSTFHVQEQDEAGNWSVSAKRAVLADFTGPRLAITSPINASTQGTIHVTAAGTASDSLTSVASVVVSGQESGNGTATLNGGTWTTGDLVLRSAGLDTLIVTATDAVGNPTVRNVVVTVNVALPQIDILYPVEGTPYNKDTITVRYKDAGADKSKLFTKAANDPDGNWPLEVESATNEAGKTNKKTVTILRDKTGPLPPTLAPVGITWTKALPAWTFTTGGDGAGSGVANVWSYAYSFNAGTATTGSLTEASFALTSGAEGTYAFYVRQQDKAGNWGPYSATSTLRYDKTAPVVTVSSPANGLITSAASVTLKCAVTGANPIADAPKTLVAGSNSLTCTQSDSAGNSDSQTITVYHVPKTVFVKTAATGAGTGISWTDAAGNLETAIKNAASGTSIWVAGGVYKAANQDSGFVVRSGISVYGGFNPNGTAKAIGERVYAKDDTTYLYNPSERGNVVTLPGIAAQNVANVVLSGLQVGINTEAQKGINLSYTNNVTLRKIKFLAQSDPTSNGIKAASANFAVDSCTFTSFSMESYWIDASSATGTNTLTMTNTVFKGNVWFGGNGMNIFNYKSASLTNVWFMDSYTAFSGFHHLGFSNSSGSIDFKDCVFKAASQNDAISIGSAANTITTTTFTPTPPAAPIF